MDVRLRALKLIEEVVELLERGGGEDDAVRSLKDFLKRFKQRNFHEPPAEAIDRLEHLIERAKTAPHAGLAEIGETALRLCRQMAGFKSAKPPRPAEAEMPPSQPRPGLEFPEPSPGPRASATYVPHAVDAGAGEPPPAPIPPGHNGDDLVHFSVTSPKGLAAGDTFELIVWAHLEAQRDEMLRLAKEAQGDDLTVKTKGPAKVQRGTELRIAVTIDGATVEPGDDTILWAGEIANSIFLVTPDAGVTKLTGKVGIFAGPIRIALIVFVLAVGADLDQEEHLHQSAFASYASADRDDVLRVIQGLEKAVPHLDVFLDVASLRSGDKWEQRLWDEISRRDVFYLFWSHNAQQSEWVDKEWRCALKARGEDFIDPVPLEGPDKAPPPRELANRHFNDWTLAFRKRGAVAGS